MSLQNYPSEKIVKASELELEQMLKSFKSEHISLWKFGCFVGFNFVALSSLVAVTGWYVKSNWVRKGQQKRYKPSQLTIKNVVIKGSKIGVLLGGLYIAGFLAVANYAMPIPVLKKYCEITEALHSFQVRYDPFYQQILLYRRMKQFGLSDQFINQVKQDINKQKQDLILHKRLKPQTVAAIRKAEQAYQKASKSGNQ